jgi:DNA-binding MarR family transcriptional regulator
MVSAKENSAPYTSIGNMLLILGRIRKGWVPNQIDKGEMERVGVTSSNASRTIVALEYLGLIDKDDKPTDTWRAIATSTTNDYPKVLEGILRNAYPSIFEIHHNPSQATDIEIFDAFAKSEPLNQRDRMKSLFIGLCQEAGLMEGEPLTRERKSATKQATQKAAPKNGDERKVEPEKQKDVFAPSEKINPALKWYNDLGTLMSRLPKSEDIDERPHWTKSERERWLTALQSMLDLLIDTDEQE